MRHHQTEMAVRTEGMVPSGFDMAAAENLVLQKAYFAVEQRLSGSPCRSALSDDLPQRALPDVFVAVWTAARRLEALHTEAEFTQSPNAGPQTARLYPDNPVVQALCDELLVSPAVGLALLLPVFSVLCREPV